MPVVAFSEQTSQVRSVAARLLSDWVDDGGFESDRLPEVRECIPLSNVHLDRLRNVANLNVVNILEPVNRWHVQVSLDNAPFGYARLRNEHGWRICSWSKGNVASRIDSAIDLADAELPPDEHETRLVQMPSLHMAMLMFVPRDKELSRIWIVPLTLPRRLQFFAVVRLYRLDALLDQLHRVGGIVGYQDSSVDAP